MLSDATKANMKDRLAKNGSTFIALHAIEEMAELFQAILKNVNHGKDNRAELLDELADVKLHIHFLHLIYGFTDEEVDDYINAKTMELNERLAQ